MKTMKKLVALMMSLCLVLAMSTSAFAATTTLKTKNITTSGSCSSVSGRVTNYIKGGGAFTGYNKANIKLNSNAATQIKNFVASNGFVAKDINLNVAVSGRSHSKYAWTSKAICKSSTTTLKLVDTNNDKKADYLYITVKAVPKNSSYDTYTGTVKVPVKVKVKGSTVTYTRKGDTLKFNCVK